MGRQLLYFGSDYTLKKQSWIFLSTIHGVVKGIMKFDVSTLIRGV